MPPVRCQLGGINPVADEEHDVPVSSSQLTELGLVLFEERPGGVRISIGRDRMELEQPLAAALALGAGLPASDGRLAELIERARAGAAAGEIGGARFAFTRGPSGLRGMIAPCDRSSAAVVHELANSLTAIAGWARLAGAAGPLPERSRSALESLDRACSDALETSRALLASLRGSAELGGGTDVGERVGEVIASLRPLVEAQRIVLRSRLPSGLVAAALPVEVRAIAMNLIKNAIEALPNGGEIVVELARRDGAATLAVVDDGPGLAESMRNKLFGAGATDKAHGSGLGLALVHDLVRRRGGRARAESGQRRGARFEVDLPLKEAVLGDRAAPARASRPPGSGVRRRSLALRRAMRVLLVEDDAAVREMVRTALELRGASVSEVQSLAGLEQLASARAPRQRFDVAIVDLSVAGEEALPWLRERQLARAIVVASGADEDPRSGADALLRKPFSIDELDETLRRFAAPLARARAR